MKGVQTDSLVCGGDGAGIAVAMSSARNGAKRLLIGRAGFSGGIITTFWRPYFDGLIDKPSGRFVVKRIAIKLLQRVGVAKANAKHLDNLRPDFITNYWDDVWIPNVEEFKWLSGRLCRGCIIRFPKRSTSSSARSFMNHQPIRFNVHSRALALSRRTVNAWVCIGFVATSLLAMGSEPATTIPLAVPAGFEIQRVASQPLVERPMFAALDNVGGLYVLDSGGVNGNGRDQKPPDVVRRLTDTDGDGIYDKSIVFADKIVFGTGLAYYDNAVFVTSPPSLWRLEDTSGDGIADKRTELVTGFAFNESCTDDVHGACLGPDGRIYFLPGRFHHKIQVPGGAVVREGVGPWLMRCRADGRDVEIVSGAVGNPVEVTFLPSGEAFLQGTFWAKPSAVGGLRDALIHAVPGGEYSVRDRDYSDRIRTGDFLPALVPLTNTAPSGLTAFLSDLWGEEYRNNLFTSHFNTGKLLRHRLVPKGGTFACETEDFVTAQQSDIHFTDVLEDADGSLLAVDTGGWYHACCPASGSSKPEVKGSIYRVSRIGVSKPIDLYGNSLPWNTLTITDKTRLLDDPRPAVRERAIQTLSKSGDAAVAELAKVLESRSATLRHRRNAVWTLCRMDGPAARETARIALSDPETEVRQAAAYCVALHRDEPARNRLIEMLRDDSSAVRREAANALGRIGRSEAVAELLEAAANLSKGNSDRFLQHAYIFSLISINDAAATRRGLSADSFAERHAALLALDQMSNSQLNANDIGPLLAASDPELQQAAINVLARHPEWTSESIQLLDRWLQKEELDDDRLNILAAIVRALREDNSMEHVLDKHLTEQNQLSLPARRALLLAIAKCGVADVPAKWKQGIATAIHSSQPEIQLAALQAAESLTLTELASDIRRAATDSSSNALRLASLRSLTALRQKLNEKEVDFLISRLSPETDIQERLSAGDVLAQARLDASQLRKLIPLVLTAGPIELPRLLGAFSEGTDTALGHKLVESLQLCEVELPPEMVEKTLSHYGDDVLTAARPLLNRLKQSAYHQTARLDELEVVLEKHPSNVERGREIFFGKALCHLCHTVAGRGGKVGPDLSDIGGIRSNRDLLEAVAFPSATFARGFEPMLVLLNDGQVLTGLTGREATNELVVMVVKDNKPVEVSLSRDRIEQVQVGRVSTMPNGLDKLLEPQELSDLIGYMKQLRTTQLSSNDNK